MSFLVIATAVVTWLRHRQNQALIMLATAAIVLLMFQVILGGITVLNDLPPEVVTAHLATALALFATLVALATLASTVERAKEPPSVAAATSFQPWVVAGALALYTLMLTGSYVVGSGASLVSLDWPLVNNTLFPGSDVSLTERLLHIQWLHRFSVLLVSVVIGLVAWRAIRRQEDARIAALAWVVVGLYVAQVFVGAANIWTRLNVVIAALHLALASATWASLVVMFVRNRLTIVRGRIGALAAPLARVVGDSR